MENNYQQRVRKRAELFYARVFPLGSHHMVLDDSAWKPDLINLAKLFVDIEAEAFDNGYSCAIMKELGHAGYEKSDCKIRCGLIPPPENSEQGGGGE